MRWLRPSQVLRLLRINYVLMKHGLDDVIFATHLFRPFRFVIYVWPQNWFLRFRGSRAVRIRKALEDLGPIFIKFGQMLSTRRDLLPDDVADELAKLQDKVPPFAGKKSREIINKAFGKEVEEVFDEFDLEPLASASVAQVHTAKLKDGTSVVVKVLRPDVRPVINRDIGLMYIIAEFAERYSAQMRRLRPVEVVAEYEKTILDELDLMREAANASQLKRNFEDSVELYVPDIYWDYTRTNVMAMERIHGVPIGDTKALHSANVNMEKLAARGVEIFFTQVFKHNFFHADMHPGNIFVETDDPESAKYIAVDFGIMGTLSPIDQRYLAENFLAFFKRDYHRVAQLHVDSGWVPEGTRVEEFESAIRTVCEPIFERPLKEISFGQLLLRLFQTARRFNMEVQPQLVLLQKTLLNIEGLGRQLYPDLDLWVTAKPFLENWMREQVGFRALFKGLQDSMPMIAEKFPDVPGLLYDAMQRIAIGDKQQQFKQRKEIELLRLEIRRSNHRTGIVVASSSFIVSAFIIFGLDGFAPAIIAGAPVLSWLLGGVGIFGLLVAVQY